jgi:hypothetical protein
MGPPVVVSTMLVTLVALSVSFVEFEAATRPRKAAITVERCNMSVCFALLLRSILS